MQAISRGLVYYFRERPHHRANTNYCLFKIMVNKSRGFLNLWEINQWGKVGSMDLGQNFGDF